MRGTLPNDRTRSWFVNVFCAGKDPGIRPEEDIWPYIGSFNLYDPTNLYAAVKVLRDRFFKPALIEVNGVEHMVIGCTRQDHGINNIHDLQNFMVEIEVEGLL